MTSRHQPGDARRAWSGKGEASRARLAEENAERLSFAGKSFDAYTIAFGIRNLTDIRAALREAHRVLKTGGRFYCLEFSKTRWPGFATLYEAWARHIVPRIGKAVAKDEESYRYFFLIDRALPAGRVRRDDRAAASAT